jgi:hypothetical protein
MGKANKKLNVSGPSGSEKIGVIGKGSTEVNVSGNHEINEPIQVKFNADAGKNPANATNYKCRMFLVGQKGNEIEPVAATDQLCTKANNDWRCAKLGTAFSKNISGNIPESSTDN